MIRELWLRPIARVREDAPGARTVFTTGQRWLLLAGFLLLVALRLPHAWLHGRFLDEEATVFLAYAWHHPWADALFRAFGGYWNLAANATTLLVARLVRGGLVPLEQAPYLTMVMGLAAQALPAILILTCRAAWLAHRVAVIAALLVIAIAPATEEVFFNAMHIQFHLALCTALILALDTPGSRIGRVGYQAILVLAPLCGPGAIAILPFFALRWLLDRDPARLLQALALGGGAAIQLLVFYGANPMRGHLFDPGTIASTMFVRLIALPTIGFGKANRLGRAIHAAQTAGDASWWWSAVAMAGLAGLLLFAAARRRDEAMWLVLTALTIAAATFGFGMVIQDQADLFSVGAGERYNFLPLVLLGLALIVLARRPGFRGRRACALLCLLLLFTGATRYRKPVRILDSGPSWPAEVAAWRKDHRHPLAVWPRPWTADLSDRRRACSPVPAEPAPSDDPRYCESAWVAAFFFPPPIQR